MLRIGFGHLQIVAQTFLAGFSIASHWTTTFLLSVKIFQKATLFGFVKHLLRIFDAAKTLVARICFDFSALAWAIARIRLTRFDRLALAAPQSVSRCAYQDLV